MCTAPRDFKIDLIPSLKWEHENMFVIFSILCLSLSSGMKIYILHSKGYKAQNKLEKLENKIFASKMKDWILADEEEILLI